MRTQRFASSAVACALTVALALQSTGCAFDPRVAPDEGRAQTQASVNQSESYHHSPVTYVTSFVASLVYFPAKVLFAVGGGAISAVSYIATLGNAYPAKSIWNASVDGDYIVTPLMIEGRDQASFIGD